MNPSLNERKLCPNCGSQVFDEGPAGNCPACLFALARELALEPSHAVKKTSGEAMGISNDAPQSAKQLLPLVYEELRRLAAHKLAGEAPEHTLQATALVHEAWMRFAHDPEHRWNNREHFFRTAAEAMRRVLVDRARERRALKRGSGASPTQFSESNLAAPSRDDELLAVHDALDELARHDGVSAELIKLRYFAGLSMPEAAAALGLPVRSAERMWTFAKAWLRKALSR